MATASGNKDRLNNVIILQLGNSLPGSSPATLPGMDIMNQGLPPDNIAERQQQPTPQPQPPTSGTSGTAYKQPQPPAPTTPATPEEEAYNQLKKCIPWTGVALLAGGLVGMVYARRTGGMWWRYLIYGAIGSVIAGLPTFVFSCPLNYLAPKHKPVEQQKTYEVPSQPLGPPTGTVPETPAVKGQK